MIESLADEIRHKGARSSMVEQWPFKPLVAGSSPAALTTIDNGVAQTPNAHI